MTNYSCSFCGKAEKEVKVMVKGPAIYLCNECLNVCIYAAEQQCPGIVYELLDGIALDIVGRKRTMNTKPVWVRPKLPYIPKKCPSCSSIKVCVNGPFDRNPNTWRCEDCNYSGLTFTRSVKLEGLSEEELDDIERRLTSSGWKLTGERLEAFKYLKEFRRTKSRTTA